jgi:ECF sigma factor
MPASLRHTIRLKPTPAFAAQAAEECRRLLESLGDGDVRTIAVWKMEGYTTEKVAAKLRRAPRTIESELDLTRRRWIALRIPLRSRNQEP